MFKKEIFKAYDIRGEFGADFDEKFAEDLGRVLPEYLDAQKIVVARDMRASSAGIVDRLIEGIISTGCKVVYIGVTSTPLFYFGVIREGADGGVMVTASHLGEEFNGFKVTREKAIAIGGDELLAEAEKFFKKEPKSTGERGVVEKKDVLDEYVDVSVGHSHVRNGEIDVSVKLAGNEVVLKEIKAVLNKVGVKIVNEREEIGFELDPDGDRVVVLDSSGKRMRGDLIGGLIAGHYLEGEKVAYDMRYSRGVLEYLKSKNIEAIPSRVGHTLIKKVMRDNEIDFCGEHSGHMFFREMGYVEASALAVLKILKVVQERDKKIEELVGEVSDWSTTDEINFSMDSRERAKELLEKIKTEYSDADINETDGIRAEYPDWGFILRLSNTEAKLRLIVDARSKELMERKKRELEGILK